MNHRKPIQACCLAVLFAALALPMQGSQEGDRHVTIQLRDTTHHFTEDIILVCRIDTLNYMLQVENSQELAGLFLVDMYDYQEEEYCSGGGFSFPCASLEAEIEIPALTGEYSLSLIPANTPGTIVFWGRFSLDDTNRIQYNYDPAGNRSRRRQSNSSP